MASRITTIPCRRSLRYRFGYLFQRRLNCIQAATKGADRDNAPGYRLGIDAMLIGYLDGPLSVLRGHSVFDETLLRVPNPE